MNDVGYGLELRQEARAYYRDSGRCPSCGEPAVFHDPERGGEVA